MGNKIKVCHVISGYYRNDPRIFQRQCKSLKKAGLDVCILTNDDLNDEIIDDIQVYSCRDYWTSRIYILLFAKKQFSKRAIEIDADIYQLHSPELLSLGIMLKRKGKKVIYDAHEDLPRHIIEKDWIPKFFRRPLSIFVEFHMNKNLRRYDAIVSPHNHVVDRLKKINNNTILITNFAKVLSRDNFTLSDYIGRKSSICYSGTVYLHSNQISILDAINSLNDINYNIAGYISPEYKKILFFHPASDKINFIGRIPWGELIGFYNNSRIGIVIIDYKMNLGNKKGTFAVNKMFEYMESGLPIICSDYELWKDVVDTYNCGICVEPGNVDQISNAINFLLENPETAYQMGQNGRKAVLDKYNWQSQEIVYVDLFKNLS